MHALNYLLSVICFVLLFLGCSKPNQDTPTTEKTIPSVQTVSTSSVESTTALAFGKILNSGGLPILEKGFCYSKTSNPTIADNKLLAVNSADTFSIQLSNLEANQVYFFKSFATNEKGTGYGEQLRFETKQIPTLEDNATTIFINGGYGKCLLALNAKDGSLNWRVDFSVNTIIAPVYSNGFVYLCTDDKKIRAFDTLGSPKWTISRNNFNRADIGIDVSDGLIYDPENDAVSAYNTTDGSLAWRTKMDGVIQTMQVKNGNVYCNSQEQICLDAKTGAIKWSSNYNYINSTNVIFKDHLYSVYGSNGLLKVDLKTGNQLSFQLNYPGFNRTEALNIKNGRVYAVNSGSLGSSFTVSDSASNTLISSFSEKSINSEINDQIANTIIVTDQLAINPTGYGIFIFDALTGKEKYQVNMYGEGGTRGATLVNNILYYTTGEQERRQGNSGVKFVGAVTAFDLATRTLKWTRDFERVIFLHSAPCVLTKTGQSYRVGEEFGK